MININSILRAIENCEIVSASNDKQHNFNSIELKLNSNYNLLCQVHLKDSKIVYRYIAIIKVNSNNIQRIYSTIIDENDSLKFDYLITSRISEYVKSELEKALVNNEYLPF